MSIAERVKNTGRAFREAVRLTSRADAESRSSVQQGLKDAIKETETTRANSQKDSLLAWASNSHPGEFFLPWVKDQISQARTNARAQLSSPYTNAYYQGIEDGLRLVGTLFTKGVER